MGGLPPVLPLASLRPAGFGVGALDGMAVGLIVGVVGLAVGNSVGLFVGLTGLPVGAFEGLTVGLFVGITICSSAIVTNPLFCCC